MRKLPYRIAYSACAWLALLVALQARGAPAAQDPVEAVWRAQRLVFYFHSPDSFYSCDLLQHKTRMILRQLGAGDRIELRRVTCRELTRQARLEVFIESPVVATPENIRDITDYDSEDVLIARARGELLPSPEDLVRFPAVWKPITFSGDCAILQQLRRQILPKMSVQVLKDNARVDCSHGIPRLAVLALVATSDAREEVEAMRAPDDRITVRAY